MSQNEGDFIDAFLNEVENQGIQLSELEYLFANLLYKTDFKEREIEEILEWSPPDEESYERIREKVTVWRRCESMKSQNSNPLAFKI